MLKDSGGNVKAEALRLGSSEQIELTYTWHISAADFVGIQANDYFRFKVPGDGIFEPSSFNFNTPVDIVDPETGIVIGTFTVNQLGELMAVLNSNIAGTSAIRNGRFRLQYGVKNGKGGFLIPGSRPGHETDEAVIEEDASGSNPQHEGQGVWTPPDNKSVYKKGTLVRAEHPVFSEKVPRLQWHIRMNYLNEKMRLEGTAGFERHNVLLEDELRDPEMEIDTGLGVVFVGRVRLMTPDNKVSWHVMFYPSYRELTFFAHIPGESYDSFKTRLTQTPISSRPRVGIYPGDGTTGSKLLIYFGDLDNNSPFTYDQFPSNLKTDITTKLNELEADGQITAVQRTNTLNAYKVNDLKMAPV